MPSSSDFSPAKVMQLRILNELNGRKYGVTVKANADGVVPAGQFLQHFASQIGCDVDSVELVVDGVALSPAELRSRFLSSDLFISLRSKRGTRLSAAADTPRPYHAADMTSDSPAYSQAATPSPPGTPQPPSERSNVTQRRNERVSAHNGDSAFNQVDSIEAAMNRLQKLTKEHRATAAIPPTHPQNSGNEDRNKADSDDDEERVAQRPHRNGSNPNQRGTGHTRPPPERSPPRFQHALHDDDGYHSTEADHKKNSHLNPSYESPSLSLQPSRKNANPDSSLLSNVDYEEEEQLRLELLSRCSELADTKERLREELALLREQIEDEKEKKHQEELQLRKRFQAKWSALEKKEADLYHQLEVIKALLHEDAAAWDAEQEGLEATIEKKEAAVIARLRKDIQTADELRKAASKELEAKTRDQANLAKQVQQLRAQVSLRKEEVDHSTRKLNQSKDEILKILAESGRVENRDEEAAQYIANVAAQVAKLKIQLRSLQSRTTQLKKSSQSLFAQRRRLHADLEDAKGNIRVIVRLRPLLPSDAETPQHVGHSEDATLVADGDRHTVTATSPTVGLREFEFFSVYGPTEDSYLQQEQIFDEQVVPLLTSLFDGCNVCVMAYGQTGSGKTFTIVGDDRDPNQLDRKSSSLASSTGGAKSSAGNGSLKGGASAPKQAARLSGLFPRCLHAIFSDPSTLARHGPVTMTMLELYLDDVYDLLSLVLTGNPTKCEVRLLSTSASAGASPATGVNPSSRLSQASKSSAGGATVVGSTEVTLESEEHALNLLAEGLKQRQTHKTLRNAASSRSHLLLTLTLRHASGAGIAEGHCSQLVFVDLAGSERVGRSLSTGDRLKEAQHINKSLSALGDVMAALSSRDGGGSGKNSGSGQQAATYIPYRNSKLTSILQNCLGGRSKTLLVTCICPHIPHQHNLAESLSTLQFASRAKLVRNIIQKRRRGGSSNSLLQQSSSAAILTRSGSTKKLATDASTRQDRNGLSHSTDDVDEEDQYDGQLVQSELDDRESQRDDDVATRYSDHPLTARTTSGKDTNLGAVSTRGGAEVTLLQRGAALASKRSLGSSVDFSQLNRASPVASSYSGSYREGSAGRAASPLSSHQAAKADRTLPTERADQHTSSGRPTQHNSGASAPADGSKLSSAVVSSLWGQTTQQRETTEPKAAQGSRAAEVPPAGATARRSVSGSSTGSNTYNRALYEVDEPYDDPDPEVGLGGKRRASEERYGGGGGVSAETFLEDTQQFNEEGTKQNRRELGSTSLGGPTASASASSRVVRRGLQQPSSSSTPSSGLGQPVIREGEVDLAWSTVGGRRSSSGEGAGVLTLQV